MTLPRRQDWLGAALLACGLVTLAGPAGAQDAVIHGRVINDRGEGLPVATVQIQELNVGVFTNSEGRYAMQIPAARVTGQTVMLRVRTIGHKPATRQLTLRAGEQTQDFTLITDVNLLEAVVVTGTQEATERVKVPFSVPVTTTASSRFTSVMSVKSCVCSPARRVSWRVAGLWPMVRTRSITVCPVTRAAGICIA